MKDPQKESGNDKLKQNLPLTPSGGSPENVDADSEQTTRENRIQDDIGTGLFDLGVAIGGTGGGVVGNDNPGRNKSSGDRIEEI